MRTICLVSIVLFAVLWHDRNSAAREWTSSDGRHRIEADLVGFDAERVRLKKQDESVVVVPLEQLCETDRQWIAELAQRQASAKEILEKKGFRVSSDGLQVPEELELKTGLRELPRLRKAVLDADRQLAAAEKQVDDNQAAVTKLIEANKQLNAQLAMIRPNQVTLNNKLVAAVNANNAQIVLIQDQGKRLQKQLDTVRMENNRERTVFLEAVMKLRTLVVTIVAKYEEAANDKAVVDAVAGMNEAVPGLYELAESRILVASKRQLEKLEEQIDSDSIPLRSVSGRMVTSVVINDKPQDMVIDTGASLVILPMGIAGQCGIEVKSSDPNVILSHADGKKIPGKLVTIPSLRVGRFSAKEVKCAVLGIEALNAQPLLGKSFLERFQYELDAEKKTLTLIEVAAGDKAPSPSIQ